MQYTIKALALLAITGFAVAQLPECAKSCLDDAAEKEGCSPTDYACLCVPATQDAIQGDATGCVVEKCGIDVALNQVLPAAKALCANPPKASSSATVVVSTTAAPVETSTSTSEPETTEVSTSVESVASTSTESVAPSTTAPAVTYAPSGGAAPTGSVPTSSIPPFEGGAAQAAAGVGSFFAAGMAVLAAF